jgi:MinD-like ATPase involved in chromosome partitioning or flagellar assembly
MIELLLVSTTPGLVEALHGYTGLQVSSLPSLARVKGIVASDQPPQAIYVEDTRGTLDELWDVIRAAQSRQVLVLIGLHSVGMAHRSDFADAGLLVADARDAGALAEWIGAQLGVRKLAAAGQVTVAMASTKGGIGKTLVATMLAEGLKRRGLQVLVVDGDLSNSGIAPTFHIPPGFPSYLHLKQDGLSAFTPANVRRLIYPHASGIHFLLGSEETASPLDLNLGEWQALLQAVRALEGYDVVLVDTGPEIKKRPYAIDTARNGGFVVLPAPPGRKERAGVGNTLRVFEQHTPDLTDRCFLLYMEPEKGVTVSVDRVAPLFAHTWPKARAIGVLPRAPRQVSMADEEGDQYLSPLDVAPHSRFSRAVHHIVQALCDRTGLKPSLPMPRSSLWQRLRGEKIALLPSGVPVVGVHHDTPLPGVEVRA